MEYTIKLTQQELSIIYSGLGELPLKLSVNLLGKLQQVQQKQDKENAISIESLDFGNSSCDTDLDKAING